MKWHQTRERERDWLIDWFVILANVTNFIVQFATCMPIPIMVDVRVWSGYQFWIWYQWGQLCYTCTHNLIGTQFEPRYLHNIGVNLDNVSFQHQHKVGFMKHSLFPIIIGVNKTCKWHSRERNCNNLLKTRTLYINRSLSFTTSW